MKTTPLLLALLGFGLNLSPLLTAAPLGTGFSYQGFLHDNGQPAAGLYDLQFRLLDAPSDGNQVGSILTNRPVIVAEGVFMVTLDFGGSAFNGDARWLEIGVRVDGSAGNYEVLSPRHPLAPTPYALMAKNVSGTVAGSVSFTNAGNTFVGNGSQLTGIHSLDAVDGGPLDAVFVDGNGRVGVGTNSPRTELDVVGSVLVRADSGFEHLKIEATPNCPQGVFMNLDATGAGGGNFVVRSSGTADAQGAGKFMITHGSVYDIVVDGAGNVGVGTPSPSPGAKLDVAGAVQATAFIGGRVGVGTNSPRTELDVVGSVLVRADSGFEHLKLEATPNSPQGVFMNLDATGAGGGNFVVRSSGTADAQGAGKFMITHGSVYDIVVDGAGNVGVGTPAPSPGAKLDVAGTARVDAIEIDGGADVAEPYPVAAIQDVNPEPGMLVSIDPNHIGRMRVASGAYDRTVAGIISGANGIRPGITLRQEGTVADGTMPIAGFGRVWAFCDADANGSIQPGDLLTTSDTPGHGMRVTDHERANGAVIGKAMSNLEKGRGLVLVFVSLK